MQRVAEPSSSSSNRRHLQAVALRMLGSAAEADDAVQEAWLRLNRADSRRRREHARLADDRRQPHLPRHARAPASARREDSVDGWLPEPVVTLLDESDPEREALIADSVGLALLVVLETLSPAERLAFVLHDMFGVRSSEIAPIVDRNPTAARQLASRARRRVRARPRPTLEPRSSSARSSTRSLRHRATATSTRCSRCSTRMSCSGSTPASTARSCPPSVDGAEQVRGAVLARGAPFAHLGRPAIVNGKPGAVVAFPDRVVSLVAFTIVDGRVTEMDLLVDPDKLEHVRVERSGETD